MDIDEYSWVDVDEYSWLDERTNQEFVVKYKVKLIALDPRGKCYIYNNDISDSDTFVLKNVKEDGITTILRSVRDLKELFLLAAQHNINRIIFNRCLFDVRDLDFKISTGIRELVFNYCIDGNFSLGYFLNTLGNNKDNREKDKFNLTRLVIRKSQDIMNDLKGINNYLPYSYHRLRTVKLIKSNIRKGICSSDTTIFEEKEREREDLEEYQDQLAKINIYLDNNLLGCHRCIKACITLIKILKIRNDTVVLQQRFDKNVMKMIVREVRNSRYSDKWYDNIDPDNQTDLSEGSKSY